MGPGKLASQAGHAYLNAFLKAPADIQKEYHSGGIGTKVCLECPNEAKLRQVYELAISQGLPAVFIEDSGSNTVFNGITTATAVGIGPCTKAQARFLKKFQLHK